MTELHDEMTHAVQAQINQLARLRGVRPVDAAVAVAQSFAENLRDSRGTKMEAYWEAMVTIADRISAFDTGSR